MIDEKLLYALGAVALGWMLNSLNNYLKYRGERRKALGRVIEKLYEAHVVLVSWNQQMNDFKDQLGDFRKFEKMREAMYSPAILDNTKVIDDDTITRVAELNPFYGLKLKDRVKSFREQSIILVDAYYLSDMDNNPYMYYHQFWILAEWNYIFQKELEMIISKFSWHYGLWIYFRIKGTLKHNVSNEPNIRDYVYDHLKTLPTDSTNGLVNRLSNLVEQLDAKGETKESLERIRFAITTLRKLQNKMSPKDRS